MTAREKLIQIFNDSAAMEGNEPAFLEALKEYEDGIASVAVLNFLTYMREEEKIDLVLKANMTRADLLGAMGRWLDHAVR